MSLRCRLFGHEEGIQVVQIIYMAKYFFSSKTGARIDKVRRRWEGVKSKYINEYQLTKKCKRCSKNLLKNHLSTYSPNDYYNKSMFADDSVLTERGWFINHFFWLSKDVTYTHWDMRLKQSNQTTKRET